MSADSAAIHQRILVVDDDEIVAAGVRAVLGSDGYDVVSTHNGYAALDVLARDPVSLVITDLRMPGLSGIDLLERARKLHPGLRMIVMSGYPSRAEAADALRRGADEFLLKPVDYARLRETVREHLCCTGEKSG